MKAAMERYGVDASRVGHVVIGNVIATEPRDAYLSRVVAIDAGIPQEVPAFNVNRLCGKGLQAVLMAAGALRAGDAEIAIGGDAESMSRGPYLMPSARWGARMGDATAVDYMLGILHDPLHGIHMGITAENVASREGITREIQDTLAVQSQQRAARAIEEGRFESQIVPVEIASRTGTVRFEVDEHVRPQTTLEQLSGMKPAFKEGGKVTAGNASGINDAAAALVLATAEAVKSQDLKPLARRVSHGQGGVDPQLMGLGPVPASRIALQRAGLQAHNLDVINPNEAFAAQACAVTRALEIDPARLNPNGSGISLGHPVGATGAVIATKAIHELQRTGGRYALVTMCIGGGQGIAAIFERV